MSIKIKFNIFLVANIKSPRSTNKFSSLAMMKKQAYLSILLVLAVNVNSRPKTKHYLVDTVGKYYTFNIAYKSKMQKLTSWWVEEKSKMENQSLKRVDFPLAQKL